MSETDQLRRRLPWERFAAEFIVIVVGVLVALAVDAARESRTEARQAAEYLQQLRVDVARTDSMLDEAIELEELVRMRGLQLARGLVSDTVPAADSMFVWFRGTQNASFFTPLMGTVEALVQSGDLRLIEDLRVRTEIMDYLGSAARWESSSAVLAAESFNAFGGIRERINIPEIATSREAAMSLDWAALAELPGFASAVWAMQGAAGLRVGLLRDLEVQLIALGEALDQSQAR